MLILELSLFVSFFTTPRAMDNNVTSLELLRYLQNLNEISATTELFTALSTTPCGLSPVHCNTFCNDTRIEDITPRTCLSPVPDCNRCSCDKDCVIFGDCCPSNRGRLSKKTETNVTCIGSDVENRVYFIGDSNGYYMKNSCQTSSSSSENIQDNISPVTSQLTNITYTNRLIANCNNEDDLVEWKFNALCTRKRYKNRWKNYCLTYISPPSGVLIRGCDSFAAKLKVVDSCNITGIWDGLFPFEDVEAKCKSCHYYPVLEGGLAFKNIYCYMCNGLYPSIYVCPAAPPIIPTFSINDLVNVNLEAKRPTCNKTEWYDRIKNICREMRCWSGYLLVGQRCVMSNVSLPHVMYQFDAWFWPAVVNRSDPRLQNWTYVEAMVVESLPDRFTSLNLSYFVLSVTNMVSIIETNVTVDLPSFGVHLKFMSGNSCCRGEFEMTIDNLSERVWILHYDDSEFQFTANVRNQSTLGISQSSTYRLAREGNVLEKINPFVLFSIRDDPADEYVLFPRALPSCAHTFLHIDDFKENLDGSITLQYADIIIPLKNISVVQDRIVVVCVDTLADLYEHYERPPDPVEIAESVVSVVFSILSLICLALTFITYCTFPSLLSLPIRNTMFLVAFLFLGQFLFLFKGLAIRNTTACAGIGVLLHYIWLSVFSWMNVCSYHMFRVFVIDASKPPRTITGRKQLLRYCLYANLLPALIVVITITVNLGISSGSEIGYGGSRCYLSSVPITVVAFVGPVGVILVMNTVFFIVSVVTMAKIHKASGSAARNDKGQVYIYMKLSTLTGIFWMLSILAERIQLQVLIFVSIVLNAGQGIFIFLSYMVNLRVYRLWKGKLKSSKYVVSSQDHSSSTVSTQTVSTHL